MVTRKNLGQGQGKGYKNILGNDKSIHSQSAQGIKQPTSINESRLNSMDKLNLKRVPYGSENTKVEDREFQINGKGVVGTIKEFEEKFPNTKLNIPKKKDRTNAIEKHFKLINTDKDGEFYNGDNNPQSLYPSDSDVEKEAQIIYHKSFDNLNTNDRNKLTNSLINKMYGKKGLFTKGKDYLLDKIKTLKEEKAEAKSELLETAEVNHPLSLKLTKQQNRVRTLEKHHSEAEGIKKDELEEKLKEEREQYREIQEEITKINVQDLSNSQLEQISIRYKDDSFFGFGDSNPYRTELLRRTEFKKVLDKDIKDMKQKPIIKEEGLFDNLF